MKNRLLFLLLSFAVALSFLPACEQGVVIDEAAVRSQIDSINQVVMSAVQAKDAATIAAQYASDGQLLPPNGAPVDRAGIEQSWKDGIANFDRLEVSITDLIAYAGGATEVGRFRLFGADGAQVEEGKYITLWKQENGAWRIYRLIWNSNMPLPEPAAPADSLSVSE